MFAQVAWWAGNGLECLLLIRCVQAGLYRRYPVFYAYLSYVLLESLLRFYVYFLSPGYYRDFYWSTQFLSVVIGYGVIWEIYRQALDRYPGAARMARNLLLVIFVLVVLKAFLNTLGGHVWSPAATTAELERNLRTIQAILLLTIGGLFGYYAIPMGRNLKGMILGYGFYVSTSLINLSLRSHFGERFHFWWLYLQPASYLVTLLIWSLTLWSYQANPQPTPDVEIERDYELLTARTTKLLTQVRTYLVRTVRP